MLRSSLVLLFALSAAAQTPVPEHGRTRSVAVLVFDGVELLDFAGPVETLTVSGAFERPFRVFTVAPAARPIRTGNQVRVVPDHAAADCPPFDILIVPGGETRCLGGDAPLARLIRERGPAAEIVMSVCNGAFALADLGWLDGLEVTTHRSHLAWLREAVPSATVRSDRRFVDNGHIVTTAGVSAGIEGALHLVERLAGPEAARQAARRMDYAWSESALPVPAPADVVERGRRAWYGGNWAEAAAAYADLYAQHADDRVVRLRLGTALLLRRRVDEALPHLEAAAAAAPDDLVACRALAFAYTRGGRAADAVAVLTRARSLDPDDCELVQMLGEAHFGAAQFAEAAACMQQSWDHDRGDAPMLGRLAEAYARSGQPERAVAALELAVAEQHPDAAALLANEAFIALRDLPRFQVLRAKAH